MFDVIVCGAGPAGAIAAGVLAHEGVRVLLVDRATFPRDKLCGDTINPGTLGILQRLGAVGEWADQALRVDGMIVTGPHGARVQGEYGGGRYGLALRRRDLDAALLAWAVREGARVETGVAVRRALVDGTGRAAHVRGIVIAGGDGRDVRIPAPLVIAADGRHSTIAFGLGLARHPRRPRRWAVGAYFDGVTGVTSFGEMHVRRSRYLGLAAVPAGLVNVCLVTDDRRGFGDPASLLRRAADADSTLRDRFAAARLVSSPAILGPLAVDTSASGMPGLLLAGDAAGFIDPMTGDGLRFAIEGAVLAARVAIDAGAAHVPGVHAAGAHVELARRRRRAFQSKWRFNRLLRRVVSGAPAIRTAEWVARLAPGVLERTIAYAGDVSRP